MLSRPLILAAIGAVALLAAVAPAQADWNHDRGGFQQRGGHDWHGRDWHGPGRWGAGYRPWAYAAPPPVYYAAPPAYYAPPPVVSFGFSFP